MRFVSYAVEANTLLYVHKIVRIFDNDNFDNKVRLLHLSSCLSYPAFISDHTCLSRFFTQQI